MSNHVQSFSRRLDPLLFFLEASESCGCLCIGFLWKRILKRDKKGIKRSSEFFLKVLMGVSPFTDVYGSLRAFECLWCFASFPRTLEKGPRQGQLIWQEIGTVWASLGLGEAWWNGETIVWGLWPRWIGTVLPVWDLLLFFSDLVLLGADPFSHPVISRSFPFHYFPILFPSFSILFHPCPSLSYPFPILSIPFPSPIFRWFAGSATGKVAGPARKWWVAGWFMLICWFFQRHRVDTGWTLCRTSGHYPMRIHTSGTLVLKWAPF